MAEVKWIKFIVGTFDGSSFKKIKRIKIGGISYRDKLTAVWFELLDLAGKCNRDGFLIDNNELAYSSYEDIAVMLDRDEEEIKLCMQFYLKENMITIIDNIYLLPNWVKYQNVKGLEDIREQNRLRQKRHYDRKKQLLLELDNPKEEENEETEEESKDNKTYKSIKIQIEEFSNNEELKTTLKEFVLMREKIRKKLTNYAFYRLLNKLLKLSTDVEKQIAILNKSIENSWNNIYPFDNQTKSYKSYKKEASVPDWMEGYEKDLKKVPKGKDKMSQEEIDKIMKEAKGEF